MKMSRKGFFGRFAGSMLVSIILAMPVAANEVQDEAKRFGARSSVLDISLSPSGTKLAWISPGPGHTEVLSVIDLSGEASVSRIASNTTIHTDLSRCDWATDDRIVCVVYGAARRSDGVLLSFTRMFTVSADGTNSLSLSERRSSRALGFNQDGGDILALDVAGEEGQLLITRNYIAERTTGTRMASDKEGLGVDRFDVTDGKRRTLLQPDKNASYFLADDKGNLRFKMRRSRDSRGFLKDERVFLVREFEGSEWKRLPDVTFRGLPIGVSPVAVDSGRDLLLAYASLNGYRALVGVPLNGTGAAELIAARNDVDVDGLIRIGRQRRVVGVSYATEKRSVEYFDDELAELARSLGKALPNQPLIDFAGASADESKLIIIASSDTDPGTVYYFDKDSKNLEVLLPMRGSLKNQAMGGMSPISYPASDGTQIPGFLTLPAGSDGKKLPTIVLPHGGPAARDYWGFDWLVQFFTSRGYAVLQPNYRGSAGYGEAWFGRNGYKAWDVAIGDVNDAGRWMVSQGIADPEKLAIVGWSYGGYAALQSQVVAPDLFKAVVAIAPVTDLEYLRSDARAYTSFRFRDEQLGRGPHIASGSPRQHADQFTAPVALYHGDLDLNVNVRHSRDMADALTDAGKSVSYMEFEDLRHSLRDSDARTKMLASIDDFLNGSLDR